jgi:hypothetical protein
LNYPSGLATNARVLLMKHWVVRAVEQIKQWRPFLNDARNQCCAPPSQCSPIIFGLNYGPCKPESGGLSTVDCD